MKKSVFFFLFFFSCLGFNLAEAKTKAIFGVRWTEIQHSDVSLSSKMGFQLGALMDIWINKSTFQTGGLITQRKSELKLGSTSTIEILYIDVPLYYVYNLRRGISFYGGPFGALKLSESSSGYELEDTKTLIFGVAGGASIRLNAQFGIDFHFDRGISSVAKNFSDPVGVGILGHYYF